MSIQLKGATEQIFSVVMFVSVYIVVLMFEVVDETDKCYSFNKSKQSSFLRHCLSYNVCFSVTSQSCTG